MTTSIHADHNLPRFCRKKVIWKSITDFSIYQNIVAQIDAVHVHERVGDILKTEWFLTLDGAPL